VGRRIGMGWRTILGYDSVPDVKKINKGSELFVVG